MSTKKQYDDAFKTERSKQYPMIDAIEKDLGYAIDREWMERTARILQCPVKRNPPNWQHGRVLYALLRKYLEDRDAVCAVDIGTAKGYSAVVMARAIDDSGKTGRVVSIDVVEPTDRIARNSVLEADHDERFTIAEFTDPFLGKTRPHFISGGSLAFLRQAVEGKLHIGFAFVDGKHEKDVVREELRLLTKIQGLGDYIMFDDCHLQPVFEAAKRAVDIYDMTFVNVIPDKPSKRAYIYGRRTCSR